MPLKVLKDVDKGEGITQDEARKLDACSLKELNDAIRKDGLGPYRSALPVWTRTNIEYKAGATTALVWLQGQKKKTKIRLPLNDGWYLPDKVWGVPNGAPSSESNPDALYLWRWQDRDYTGLLARGDGGLWDWRGVSADYSAGDRLGVIASARSSARSCASDAVAQDAPESVREHEDKYVHLPKAWAVAGCKLAIVGVAAWAFWNIPFQAIAQTIASLPIDVVDEVKLFAIAVAVASYAMARSRGGN